MDVHEVLAVVVSGRQDSGDLARQHTNSLSTSPASSPISIASSPVARSSTESQLPAITSLGRPSISKLWRPSSSGTSVFAGAQRTSFDSSERHSSDFLTFYEARRGSVDAAAVDAMTSSLYNATSLPVGGVNRPKLARASFGGISRGIADFEPMFHFDE